MLCGISPFLWLWMSLWGWLWMSMPSSPVSYCLSSSTSFLYLWSYSFKSSYWWDYEPKILFICLTAHTVKIITMATRGWHHQLYKHQSEGHITIGCQTWKKLQAVLLTEDGGRRVENGELRLDQGELRKEDGEWSIYNKKLRMEGFGLRVGHKNLRISSCHNNI